MKQTRLFVPNAREMRIIRFIDQVDVIKRSSNI
jgi:hypothetical protein